jgi:hypothetical protein
VAGIMAAGVTGNYGETLRQNIDNLSFALIAPLGADDNCGLASFQFRLRLKNRARIALLHRGRTLLAPRQCALGLWDESGEDVYGVS